MNHFIFVLFRFYSQSYGGQFLCIAGLRGHWVPANSFLLHKWVSTLVLWSLVRVTLSDWRWGHFKVFFGACDLTFIFAFTFVLGQLQWELWFEILAIQAINCPGRLRVGVRVLLHFTYHFVMPKFWGTFVLWVRLVIVVIDFSGFQILWGCGVYWGWTILVTFCFATSVFRSDQSDWFPGFLDFPVY